MVTYESAIVHDESHTPKRERNSLSLLYGVLQLLTDDELRAVRAGVDTELRGRAGEGVSLAPGQRTPRGAEGAAARA